MYGECVVIVVELNESFLFLFLPHPKGRVLPFSLLRPLYYAELREDRKVSDAIRYDLDQAVQ